MKQVRIHYSTDFKIKAVELAKQRGSINQIAEELKIADETLRIWIRKHKAGNLILDPSAPVKVKSDEEQEISRLRKELYEVKMERDILKKAVSIFSKSDR